MAQKKYEKPLLAPPKTTVDSAKAFWVGVGCEERGDYSGALKAYGEAISINPLFPEALYNRALLLKNKMGDVAAAEDHYRRALDVKPNFPDALNNLGILLQNSGRFEESVALFRKALSLKPDFVSALSNLGMILYYWGAFE
jgi:Flp pilus assembly protein TadD